MPSRQLTAVITPAAMHQGLRQEVRGAPEVEQEFKKREGNVVELPSTVIVGLK